MGITNEQLNKIKNLEKLSNEDKKAILEDTQRAGFDPSIHQVRAMFDLTESIRKLNVNNTMLSRKIYWLTLMMVALTVIIAITTIVLIFK